MSPFSTIDDALADLAAGRMVVVVDEERRDDEGDLVLAAELVTPDDINFMTRQAGGWIRLALPPERCDALGLPPMTTADESALPTPFTVTIEAAEGVTTGISTADQAHTMRTAVDPARGAGDIVVPGHVRPVKASAGGVLERAGRTEAAVDLARLAGLTPAGVVCEILNEDGTMARGPELAAYCARHGLRMVTIAALVAHRRRHDKLVERVTMTAMPTAFGTFTMVGYRSLIGDAEHVALVKGDVAGGGDVLVRAHERCLAGDVFHALGCDCGERLEAAMRAIEGAGRGVLLYLAEGGEDGVGAQILADLGLRAPTPLAVR